MFTFICLLHVFDIFTKTLQFESTKNGTQIFIQPFSLLDIFTNFFQLNKLPYFHTRIRTEF